MTIIKLTNIFSQINILKKRFFCLINLFVWSDLFLANNLLRECSLVSVLF